MFHVHSVLRASALVVAAGALALFPSEALAQFGFPGVGGPLSVGSFPGGRGTFGQQGFTGGNPGAAFNQNQGIIQNQTNTRNRFALNTSVAGSGVLNSALDPVTAFGIGLNTGNQGG